MYRPLSNVPADARALRDVETQLRELTKDFGTSFNTGNYDQAASLFARDGVLMAPHYDGAYGQQAVERLLRKLGDAGYNNLRMETVRVDHSGDMAMELGKFSIAVRMPDGTTIPEHGKYVRVWRRFGAWLIVGDCWSRTPMAVSERAA